MVKNVYTGNSCSVWGCVQHKGCKMMFIFILFIIFSLSKITFTCWLTGIDFSAERCGMISSCLR